MAPIIAVKKRALEIAHILQKQIEDYKRQYRLGPEHPKILSEAAQALLRFGQNERGGTPGFLAVLHTWDQKLKVHFHLHCRVAGGVVAENGNRWIAFKGNYLFNQTALSRVFRGKFMQLLHRACQTQKLKGDPQWYQILKTTLFAKNWVVRVRDPVKQPAQVLDYLARYTPAWQLPTAASHPFKTAWSRLALKIERKTAPSPLPSAR